MNGLSRGERAVHEILRGVDAEISVTLYVPHQTFDDFNERIGDIPDAQFFIFQLKINLESLKKII